MFWIIGGEFNSMNFHTLDPATRLLEGPFNTRQLAEDRWKEISIEHKHKAQFRFLIVEEKNNNE